jgi:Domain of unknown function (DUF4184)
MPFTPAHAAIVLPFIRKKHFSATALIVGSVSPDFEYFLTATRGGEQGHTVLGLFYFDLPVALFFAYVFHQFVKQSLIGNLPEFLQRRFSKTLQFDFKKYFNERPGVVIYSALLGAASHVFWDSFTHNSSFIVRNLDIYRSSIPLHGAHYPLFYALQHISTAIGLSVILVYVFLMPTDSSYQTHRPQILYWVFMVLIGSIFFVARFAIFPDHFNLGNAVVTGMTSLILSLCALGFVKSFNPNPRTV